MQTQIAFYDCFCFYVQPAYFTAIISEKFRMRKYHFREFPLQIWQKWIVNKILNWQRERKAQQKGDEEEGFLSLYNKDIIIQ